MTVGPRAQGQRIPYAAAPEPVRAWVEEQLGAPVVSAVTQVGGFSPGTAARLVTSGGRRAFVKAVGGDANPDTPDLFRHEIAVLSVLPEVPYRAALRASYDDGAWVALLLDDVEGRHPDLHDDVDRGAVRSAVVAQSRELTPDPVRLDVPGMAETAARWHRAVLRGLDEATAAFPDWFLVERDVLLLRLESLAARMPAESWVHLDVRDDNCLLRADGSAVLLDWGMSRPGPAWIDQVLLAVHRVDTAAFDDEVAQLVPLSPSSAPGSRRDDDVTDLVLSLGASLAAIAHREVPGLPAIGAFRRREADRLLEGARRRLGA